MSDAELQAIRERCEKATPGPWEVYDDKKHPYQNGGLVASDDCLWGGYDNGMPDDDTIAFMAHARADVPALLAEVERLRELEAHYQSNDPGKHEQEITKLVEQ